jgi:N-acetylated-alpha-linked acidic dipeptidase
VIARPIRARLVTLVAALALAAVALPSTAFAGDGSERLPGFTGKRSAEQLELEKRFKRAVSARRAGEISRTLSGRPQLIGSPGLADSLAFSLERLSSYGLDAGTAPYEVYISRPESIDVSMTAPYFRQAAVKEPRYPWQNFFDEVVVGYNAYSPSGDVSGEVVYVNYGLPEDYEALAELGVDVEGKIALARYGQSFRGVKAKVAEEQGARGLIIYSDPEEDGFVKGPVYPDGQWRSPEGIQRGSIQYIFEYPGDPLTPGLPSVSGTPRIAPADAENLPRIPTTPLSYGEAEPLLRELGGPEAPEEFQGGLDFTYRVGPGPTEARLNLDIAYEQQQVNDIVVEIPGAKHPDQKVVVGAHYDAWTYGTDDNTSAWTAVLEIGRGLSRLLERGWRPDRTIVLVGWDGEEYGLLGSTEWVEQYRDALRRDAVAYLNMDGVGGREFGASSVPSLDALIEDVTKEVRDPSGEGTVFDAWSAEGPPEISRLGSGSDYTAFLDHVGVPALDSGFQTGDAPGGEYHASYDDTYMMENFLDPDYKGHAAAARVTGLLALRLADADVPPFLYSAYAEEVEGYVADLDEEQAEAPIVDLSSLATQAGAWREAAEAVEARIAALLDSDAADTRAGRRLMRRLSAVLRRQERLLTAARGLPGRPWFKHQIYAPGRLTGYAAVFLPALDEAIEDGDAAIAEEYRDLLVRRLARATEELREAAIP